jgi:unsaturated chondroitin disaccharide hydrolase
MKIDVRLLTTMFLWIVASLTGSVAQCDAGVLPDSLLQRAITVSISHLRNTAVTLNDSARFPRSAPENGSWKMAGSSDWTSGFFAGCLWYAYELSGDTSLQVDARRWTERLDKEKWNTRTHDIGFIINCSFGNGFRLTQDTAYRAVLVTAAGSLASRYSSIVGSIRSWDNRKWAFPVIIDNMMNLELLFAAARAGGSEKFRLIAVQHAMTTMRNHFREDGSTYHVVSYDSTTGAVRARETHQGFANESVWARGQAWAITGFAMAYRETGDRRFLETALRAARYFIDHLPSDSVPYWDFDAPGIPQEPRDASAAAIACSGLLQLCRDVHESAVREGLLDAATNILNSLCREKYLAVDSAPAGILKHAVGNKPAGLEIDVSLIYADYYFLESLVRYSELMKE